MSPQSLSGVRGRGSTFVQDRPCLPHRTEMRAAIGTSWKGNRSLADYIFVLTTLNREDFSVRESLELYRARWQVEKLFQTP